MAKKNRYTVRQIANLAGVSVRTLHYYDEIGLLKPAEIGANNYRYYDDAALFRLQQILLYRELDLDLQQIKHILDLRSFDKAAALQTHRKGLQARIERLQTLIDTVDATINHLNGAEKMSKKKIFEGFNDEQQERYKKEAMQQFGADSVQQSYNLWNSYSDDKKAAIMAEAGAIYTALAAQIGQPPESEAVQDLLVQWHENLRNFYEPSFDVLRGLGNMYNDHPEFNANLSKFHPGLPGFLQIAIEVYVDKLETQWLERELGILEE